MLEILMAFAPLIFLIVYALKTRRMAESMVLATLLAMALLHRQHFLTGAIDALYGALSNSSYQFVLCITIGFGGMITLFQESGALMGFRDLLLKVAGGPKRTLVLAWCMSAVMFLDEYLNALTVTFSMREITDRNRIPREHLALQANIMACCLCMTIPFSSWTAFSVGLISEYDLGFGDYLRAIPYMLYPLCMMLLCLLLAVGAFPKLGPLKQAYQRVRSGGPAFEKKEKAEKLVDVADVDESRASSAWNAVGPLAFLLVGGHGICRRRLLGGDDHRHPRVRAAGPVHGRDGAHHHRRRHERYRSGIQHLLLRRRSVYDHSGHRRVQHYHHQGHAALCRRRCGWVSAVRDTGVREPAGRFRREAPLHILYGALTWRAAGDML